MVIAIGIGRWRCIPRPVQVRDHFREIARITSDTVSAV
jgi:hypothetical protein